MKVIFANLVPRVVLAEKRRSSNHWIGKGANKVIAPSSTSFAFYNALSVRVVQLLPSL